MKKVTLKELVAGKIIFAVLVALYYWMWARNDWKDFYPTIQTIVGGFTFWYFVFRAIRVRKYKQEAADEMAEANLHRCDSICLKICMAALIGIGFACAIGRLVLHRGHRLLPDGNADPDRSRAHDCILADGRERTLSMALVTKLKEYRERDDLKQAELAELVGVRRETIVNLEKGKYNPSLKLAMDIAKVFHTTVEELFAYTED